MDLVKESQKLSAKMFYWPLLCLSAVMQSYGKLLGDRRTTIYPRLIDEKKSTSEGRLVDKDGKTVKEQRNELSKFALRINELARVSVSDVYRNKTFVETELPEGIESHTWNPEAGFIHRLSLPTPVNYNNPKAALVCWDFDERRPSKMFNELRIAAKKAGFDVALNGCPTTAQKVAILVRDPVTADGKLSRLCDYARSLAYKVDFSLCSMNPNMKRVIGEIKSAVNDAVPGIWTQNEYKGISIWSWKRRVWTEHELACEPCRFGSVRMFNDKEWNDLEIPTGIYQEFKYNSDGTIVKLKLKGDIKYVRLAPSEECFPIDFLNEEITLALSPPKDGSDKEAGDFTFPMVPLKRWDWLMGDGTFFKPGAIGSRLKTKIRTAHQSQFMRHIRLDGSIDYSVGRMEVYPNTLAQLKQWMKMNKVHLRDRWNIQDIWSSKFTDAVGPPPPPVPETTYYMGTWLQIVQNGFAIKKGKEIGLGEDIPPENWLFQTPWAFDAYVKDADSDGYENDENGLVEYILASEEPWDWSPRKIPAMTTEKIVEERSKRITDEIECERQLLRLEWKRNKDPQTRSEIERDAKHLIYREEKYKEKVSEGAKTEAEENQWNELLRLQFKASSITPEGSLSELLREVNEVESAGLNALETPRKNAEESGCQWLQQTWVDRLAPQTLLEQVEKDFDEKWRTARLMAEMLLDQPWNKVGEAMYEAAVWQQDTLQAALRLEPSLLKYVPDDLWSETREAEKLLAEPAALRKDGKPRAVKKKSKAKIVGEMISDEFALSAELVAMEAIHSCF